MHLLYVDESGQHGADYFVLAGLAVFERQVYWLANEVERIQTELFPGTLETIDFHASVIRAGSTEPWSSLSLQKRLAVLDRVYGAIRDSRAILFGVAVERAWLQSGQDPYLFAFENLVQRFDQFLSRLNRDAKEEQRGLIIMAGSEFQQRLESLFTQVLRQGTQWGQLRRSAATI